ncbi:MAG TPA: response regulator [Noviherbaspirillum sp.]
METPPATILIVDDDERNRKLLDVFARADGHQTISARDGEEALLLAAAHAPDLILLDLMMPGMDGFDLLRRLKDHPATQSIPLIIVSALNDVASGQRIAASGVDDFIRKPVDRWELSLRMCRLLRHG